MEVVEYLKQTMANEASDLFLLAGAPATVKVRGHIGPLDDKKLSVEDMEILVKQLYAQAGRSIKEYAENNIDDFSFAIPGLARFRVNAYRQRGSQALVIRAIPFVIPDWKKLNIPEEVMNLADITSGLILITGASGSGKSATQACIIDRINKSRQAHIITLEDPIEYLHRHDKSIVSQCEIAVDTKDPLTALRASLRQAPDVIQLGEMYDCETLRTAITAAETGRLVIATLHTRGVVNSIERIIDSFPGAQHGPIRTQLSGVLRSVVSQQLLPEVGGGRIPAFEIMHVDSAIRVMIRDNKTYQINNAIASYASVGMISMDQYILNLYREGRIDRTTAISFCDNPDQLANKM